MVRNFRNSLSSHTSGKFSYIPLTDKFSVKLSIITACLSLSMAIKELRQKEDSKLMGFGPPPRRSLWLETEPWVRLTLMSPAAGSSTSSWDCSSLVFLFTEHCAQASRARTSSLHSSQIQSKVHFALSSQLDSLSSLLSVELLLATCR